LENQKRVNDKLRKIQATRRLMGSNSKKNEKPNPNAPKEESPHALVEYIQNAGNTYLFLT
jgi:hypothetical protein